MGDHNICTEEDTELNLEPEDSRIENAPSNTSHIKTCDEVGLDLENQPNTSTNVEQDTNNYKLDILETTKSGDHARTEADLIDASNASECVKTTAETEIQNISECNVDLELNVDLEGKYFCQEDTEMKLSCASVEYKFENACQITGAWKEFRMKDDIFMKGCKWSPDGTCLLTNSDDNVLRVFDLPRELHCQEMWQRDASLPELEPALRVQEGGVTYDYSWYPLMSSWNPLSCCFVSTSKDSPVHLWDAFNGELRCTYRAYNAVDEVEAANSLAFSPSGEKLYCGFKDTIRVFNTNIPGRDCTTRNLKRQFPTQKQTGIISCISVNPVLPNVYAAGSYSRTIGVYSEPHGTLLCLLLGHRGGITHLQFSSDGTKLLSGGRKDSEIICWDIRNPGNVLFTVKREVSTNQRIYFDITSDSQYVVSGNTNGTLSVWNISQIAEANTTDPILSTCCVIKAHNDCINGISIHQQYPILATTSGQRHIKNSDSESESPTENVCQDTSLKLWWVGNTSSS